jgi:arylsulfatase A-like enzyme
LIVAAPGLPQNRRTSALVELLDLYPTLAELSRLPPGHGLEGKSFVPILRDPTQPGKAVAISQHPHPSYTPATHMGYALRTDRYRYVEWRDIHTGVVTDRELYDEETDPMETVNRAGRAAYAEIEHELAAQAAEIVRQGGRWSGK